MRDWRSGGPTSDRVTFTPARHPRPRRNRHVRWAKRRCRPDGRRRRHTGPRGRRIALHRLERRRRSRQRGRNAGSSGARWRGQAGRLLTGTPAFSALARRKNGGTRDGLPDRSIRGNQRYTPSGGSFYGNSRGQPCDMSYNSTSFRSGAPASSAVRSNPRESGHLDFNGRAVCVAD